ncbi:MAG: hypothetical protein ACK559_26315 [bacterium]
MPAGPAAPGTRPRRGYATQSPAALRPPAPYCSGSATSCTTLR